jgi:hypothetical protein
MPLMTWELWLARDIVADKPLPWQKRETKLTPGRLQLFHNNTAHPDTLTDYPFFQRATQRGIAFVVTGFRRGWLKRSVEF